MNAYTFNISLSILNHLGRNLYRSFITVLGEAISNAWDADAQNVRITIDRDKNILIIEDDGRGMTDDDFQNKFLKIGYSKRKDNVSATENGRPFIGRKGIGKLALLSCAKRITVLTKTVNTDLVGGIIDNSGLDEAIKDDVSTNEYKLGVPDVSIVERFGKDMVSGTVILFEEINDGIRNRIEYIRKLVALYFRFSLLDPAFRIFLNGSQITLDELTDLINGTQFLWKIDNPNDPYISEKLQRSEALKKQRDLQAGTDAISGFIASVEKPSMLKIRESEEKVSIDLYVNGRLREKNILKHIPTTRIVESYLYGQIHYNALDDENDRFTSSREGVVSDDPKFVAFLKEIEELLRTIIDDWDKWRTELNQDGDSENKRISRKERKSKELFNAVVDDFIPPKTNPSSRQKVEQWVYDLGRDAEFNFTSYGECFVAENLLRKYIDDKNIPYKDFLTREIEQRKESERRNKEAANICIDIRQNNSDLSYASMSNLAKNVDNSGTATTVVQDAKEFKPIRDALAHTSLLTNEAKSKLTSVFNNIKARIIQLLNMA
jgi:hypothetical protein